MERSKEFLEGWNASAVHIIRGRNPYVNDPVKYEEWEAGWSKRFFGEDIDSEP